MKTAPQSRQPRSNHAQLDRLVVPSKVPSEQTKHTILITGLAIVIFILIAAGCRSLFDRNACTTVQLTSDALFSCDASLGLGNIRTGAANTYQSAKQHFPQAWGQLGWNQAHQPVFPVSAAAPAFLHNGAYWATPLTGLEFQRLRTALPVFPQNGGQTWASTVAGALGVVMGVSVAQGIVFAQLSNGVLAALDAESGHVIWQQPLINAAGMGQTVVGTVNNRLMVFAPVGDAVFNLENTVNFTRGLPHDRGGQFAGLFAFDGLTGTPLWTFPTKGAARPVPVLKNGRLHLATSGGDFFVIDAATGAELGSSVNPGDGYPGLASLNWYETTTGKLFIVYGTLRPRRILAMDVTDPAAPSLAWQYAAPAATANSTGDTAVAVDQTRGLVVTTVFTDIGQSAQNIFDLRVIALNAENGTEVWSDLTGTGPNIPGFKASIPMLDQNKVYLGNSLSQELLAYNLDTGQRLWTTNLRSADDAPSRRRRPGSAGVIFENKLIHAEGDKIRTLDTTSGEIINTFQTSAEHFAVWPITQPVIVGRQMYLGSLSGWIFGLPVDHILESTGPGMREPGFLQPIAKRQPQIRDNARLPTALLEAKLPLTWERFAHGPTLNAVTASGPSGITWQTPLEYTLPLGAPPHNQALYGAVTATNMTSLAMGASAGLAPAKGMVFVGSGRQSIHALNAESGAIIWTHKSVNGTPNQPLVTRNSVIYTTGSPYFNLGTTGDFKQGLSRTQVFANFEYVTALNPRTGEEKWTVYAGTGTASMTPLLHKNRLFWLNGTGDLWAVHADTGAPVRTFMNTTDVTDYQPAISLEGFNVWSAANVYTRDLLGDIMVVGSAMPNQITGINLQNASIEWKQPFAAYNTYLTGFSGGSLAVHQTKQLVIGSVLIDAEPVAHTATVMAFALHPTTGAIVWTQAIGTGSIPSSFASPTPVIDDIHAYFHNPMSNTVVALDLTNGAPTWQTNVTAAAGKLSWGQGVLVGTKLIQPVGASLITLDKTTGNILNEHPIGGAFVRHSPVVLGPTLYIGNAWGWVFAYPLAVITGDPSDG